MKKTLVVKFNSKKSKDVSMIREEYSVLIYDFLSRETLSLLKYVKTVKNVGYRDVYAAGGRVFCKKANYLSQESYEVKKMLT